MRQLFTPYTISWILILTVLTLGFQCMKPPPGDKVLETPSGLEKEMQNIPEDRPMMAENIALGITLGLDPELQYIPEYNPLTAEKI